MQSQKAQFRSSSKPSTPPSLNTFRETK
jgi:hypothetical protein